MKRESWILEKMVAEFKRNGGVVKKLPMGIPANGIYRPQIGYSNIPAYQSDVVVSNYVSYEKSTTVRALQSLITKTGLPERMIPKALKTSPEEVRRWFREESIPYHKYEALKRLVRDQQILKAFME